MCEFIIDQCLGLRRLLDMRLLINSFQDYLQWLECQSGCHWHDMVAARIKERPTTINEASSPDERRSQKQRELDIAREIAAETKDRNERRRRWIDRTGKSEPTLYRRLAELREQ